MVGNFAQRTFLNLYANLKKKQEVVIRNKDYYFWTDTNCNRQVQSSITCS